MTGNYRSSSYERDKIQISGEKCKQNTDRWLMQIFENVTCRTHLVTSGSCSKWEDKGVVPKSSWQSRDTWEVSISPSHELRQKCKTVSKKLVQDPTSIHPDWSNLVNMRDWAAATFRLSCLIRHKSVLKMFFKIQRERKHRWQGILVWRTLETRQDTFNIRYNYPFISLGCRCFNIRSSQWCLIE